MKTIILSLIFYLTIQAQGFNTLGLLMGDDYLPETIAYKTRVLADGGVILNIDSLNANIATAKLNGTFDSLYFWWNKFAGVKKNANNKVTKLYSIYGTSDAVQADTSKAWTYVTGYCSTGADDYYKIVKTISAANFEMSTLFGLTFNVGTLADQIFIAFDNSESSPLAQFYGINNAGANRLRLANSPGSGTITGLIVTSAIHYLGFRVTESSSEILYLDGVASSTATAGSLTTNITNIRIGSNMYSEKYLKDAKVYEIKIFTKNLSDTKWTLEQTYFNERY